MMIKFAFIGCGRIAKRHAEVIKFHHSKRAILQCVCDVDQAKANDFADQYDTRAYGDMHTMIRSEDPDVLCVLTESGHHAEHVIELANYGKNIIVEKPMALTVESAQEMIQVCESNGIKLFVVKQNRYNLPVTKLKEAIEADAFGKLFLGTIRVRWCRRQDYYDQDEWRGSWKLDGGVIANQASHHIDLLLWCMGEPESVFAKSINALADIEAEDTLIANIKFKNGGLGIIEATTATRPKDLEGSISIFGEHGSVEISGFAVNKIAHWNFQDPRFNLAGFLDGHSENPPDVYGFGHSRLYENIIDVMENKKIRYISGSDGIPSVKLINALYRSIETNSEIYMDENIQSHKLGK